MNEKDQIELDLKHCLGLCSQGNKSAFEIIYRHTAPKFTAIVMGMVKHEAMTADILQRTYISVWKNAHKYDPDKGKAFTWMLVILRNRAIDAIRKNSKYLVTEVLDETLIDEKSHSDEKAEAALLRRMISPHMDALPDHVAKAIKLHVVYGWSCREVGEFFDVPTHTAKSWIRRGLIKVKSKMPEGALEVFL